MAVCSIVGRWLFLVGIGLLSPQSSPVKGLKLNGPLPAEGDVLSFATAGSFAVYRADQDADQLFELFSVPIDASAGPVQLNGFLVPGGDTGFYVISPDGTRVVYSADQETNDVVELYVVPIDASAGPVKLNPPLVAGGDLSDAWISPDGTRVLYRADQDANDVLELHTVPIDASSGPVKLNGSLAPGGDVTNQVRFDSTGTRVVYAADQVADERFELFSVPADASASAVRLNGPLVAGGDTGFYHISPDGARVVYPADQDTNDVVELYVVPIDASAGPEKLNPSLVAGGDVSGLPTDVQISSDGARVVYLADQETDQVLELFSVPIDGSAPSVKLNGALPLGGRVSNFQVTPDGSLVVYQTQLDDVEELFSVSIDRSTEPVKISGDPGGDLIFSTWKLSPDGARAVYSVHLPNPIAVELRSVAVDGSSAATLLHGSSSSFKIADARTVVYKASNELYSIPIDGSAGPIKLNRPLPPGGTVGVFDTWSERAFYLADQDVAGTVELYVSFFTRPFLPGPALRGTTTFTR